MPSGVCEEHTNEKNKQIEKDEISLNLIAEPTYFDKLKLVSRAFWHATVTRPYPASLWGKIGSFFQRVMVGGVGLVVALPLTAALELGRLGVTIALLAPTTILSAVYIACKFTLVLPVHFWDGAKYLLSCCCQNDATEAEPPALSGSSYVGAGRGLGVKMDPDPSAVNEPVHTPQIFLPQSKGIESPAHVDNETDAAIVSLHEQAL